MRKSKVNGKAIAVIAIAIILILAVLAWLISAAALNTNAICLFGHKYGDNGVCTRCGAGKPSEPPVITDNKGNAMDSNTIHEMPQGLIFASARNSAASAQANYPSVTVKATVEPVSAQQYGVTWSVKFADEESAWAAGKTVTDYVTVTQSSADKFIATITCKQAFSSQILVTITSDVNGVSASCTVDFKKQLETATMSYVNVQNSSDVAFTVNYDNVNREITATGAIPLNTVDASAPTYKRVLNLKYTDGTVEGEQPIFYLVNNGTYTAAIDFEDTMRFDGDFYDRSINFLSNDGENGFIKDLEDEVITLSVRFNIEDIQEDICGCSIEWDLRKSPLSVRSITLSQTNVVF